MRGTLHCIAIAAITALSHGCDGVAVNFSTETTCAEEDNVNVPIYFDDWSDDTSFTVVATHPLYALGPDDATCLPDFTGCETDQAADVVCQTVYDDGTTVVSICVDSQWWRPHDVLLTTPQGNGRGHIVQVHRKIADADSWPEVLVINQDAYLRLKPHPPEGLSDTCFGSSILVGPALPATRPFVDIASVDITPDATGLSLTIVYANDAEDAGDGGTATMRFVVDRTRAVLTVDAQYGDSRTPFATLRSMFVANDNADCSRLSTSKGAQEHILGPWRELRGTSWFFHRVERSEHNPSSPDLQVLLGNDIPASAGSVD